MPGEKETVSSNLLCHRAGNDSSSICRSSLHKGAMLASVVESDLVFLPVLLSLYSQTIPPEFCDIYLKSHQELLWSKEQ